MLSAHYAGTPPLLPHPHQPAPVSTPHSIHSHHHYAQHPHTMSTLLPTPPSSPPAPGLHPIENTITLLESLVAFYHQERMWVYRTRAQLEMDMLQRVEDTASNDPAVAATEAEGEVPQSGTPSPSQSTSKLSPQSQADSQASQQPSGGSSDCTSSSPPTKWLKRKRAFNLRLEGISTSRGGAAKSRPYRPRQGSSLNPAGPQPAPTPHGPPPRAFYPPPGATNVPGPATTTLTSPYLYHPSFAATFGPPPPAQPPTPSGSHSSSFSQAQTQPDNAEGYPAAVPFILGAGGREPSVQILEMFEKMMQARMESCERVTRMVRSATASGGICQVNGLAPSVGGPVGAPGIAMNMPIVGGAVGGPDIGAPVSLTMNGAPDLRMDAMDVVPNGGAYASGMMTGTVYGAQDMAQAQEQSQAVQDFPMGVAMG